MASTATPASTGGHGPEATRRDFLFIATATVGAVGAAATLVPLIDQMNPDASTLAAGGPVDLDVSKIEENSQVMIRWRERPIFVFHRSKQTLDSMQSQQMVSLLVRSEFRAAAAAALCRQLASLAQAGIRHPGRHLHPSRLHPAVLSDAERHDAGHQLAGRLFLPLPRLEIRSGRPRLLRACRRRTICRCRPTASSTPRRCASARTIRARRPGISIRSASSEPPAATACFRTARRS